MGRHWFGWWLSVSGLSQCRPTSMSQGPNEVTMQVNLILDVMCMYVYFCTHLCLHVYSHYVRVVRRNIITCKTCLGSCNLESVYMIFWPHSSCIRNNVSLFTLTFDNFFQFPPIASIIIQYVKWSPLYYICMYTTHLDYAVFSPTCTTAAILKYFNLKRLVDQIGRVHNAMKVLQIPLKVCVYLRLILLLCTLTHISWFWWLTLEYISVLVITCACLFNKICFLLFNNIIYFYAVLGTFLRDESQILQNYIYIYNSCAFAIKFPILENVALL